MKKFTSSGVTVEYHYDPFGRRINKSANGINVYYIYDEDDVLLEYDSSINLSAKYIMHPQLVDIPFVQKRNNMDYHYNRDGLGSVITLTDENANINNTYKYYSFGGSKEKSETVENRYQYTSRENDNENDLYYYRSRMYNPIIGRFNQEDKYFQGNNIKLSYAALSRAKTLSFILNNAIGKLIENRYRNEIYNIIFGSKQLTDEINLYKYTGNNPINYIDPYGWATEDCEMYDKIPREEWEDCPEGYNKGEAKEEGVVVETYCYKCPDVTCDCPEDLCMPCTCDQAEDGWTYLYDDCCCDTPPIA